MESTERLSTFISEGELSQQLEGHTSGESHLKPTETVPCWPLHELGGGYSAFGGEVGACAAGVREPEPGRRAVEKLRRGAQVIRNGYSTVSFRLCNLHFNDNRINPGLQKLL